MKLNSPCPLIGRRIGRRIGLQIFRRCVLSLARLVCAFLMLSTGLVCLMPNLASAESLLEVIPTSQVPSPESLRHPHRLHFLVQPENSRTGAVSQIEIAIEDSHGLLVDTDQAVSVEIVSAKHHLAVIGQATVQAIHGIATFADLHLRESGKGCKLHVLAGPLATAYSKSFDVHVDKEFF